MRTANELTIRGERTHLEHLLARVEALLRDGWKRDRQAEERLGRHGAPGPWAYCFSCTAKADRPAAGLWVHARGPEELYVATVVPLEKQQLTEEESNRLLAEFEREVLGPAAAEVGVETEIVQHRLTLEHDLSPEAVRLLRAFSASANRACLHPNDRRRWNAFLIRVHQDESLFDPASLDAWLQQEGWPEDTRCQLIEEYEMARSLLSAYDEEAEALMPALATVVADLLARPRPVLCLDTCDLLDIIQCVAEGKARRLEHVRRLLDTLALRPDRVQLVVSYLVAVEWAQNQAAVVADVERKMRTVDEDIADIHRAWQHAGAPLPGFLPSYAGGGLPAALAALAATVMGWAAVLDRDDTYVGRALDRVHTRARPSHAGMVKDSIHLEHYLELCRQLHASGFPGRRVLVSANKADFWEARNKPDIHPDLAPQLTAVGLEFFGTLEAALGSLGI